MDPSPFLSIQITDLKDNQIPELAKFHKDNFDIDKITSSASELKYLNNLKSFVTAQLDNPTEAFVKYFVGEIYDGQKNKSTLDKFAPIIKKGFNQIISERVSDKLSAALNTSVSINNEEVESTLETKDNEIVTTPEELEAFTTVKLILKDTIVLDRVYYRDNRSYFNILLDNNIRKWILRFFSSSNGMKIELNTSERTVFEVETPIDIINHSNEIISITKRLIN